MVLGIDTIPNYMRQPIIILLTFSLLCLGGCASVFNGRYQEVQYQKSNDTEIFLDGEQVEFSGNRATIEMPRDGLAHQMRIEKEGYKPIFTVIGQNKSDGKVWLTPLINAGIGAAIVLAPSGVSAEDRLIAWLGWEVLTGLPVLYTMGKDATSKKGNNYKEVINLPPPNQPLMTRTEEKKYLFSQAMKVNLSAEDLEIYTNVPMTLDTLNGEISKRALRRLERNRPLTLNQEQITIENTVFTDAVNQLLFNTGFMDTTKTLIKVQGNTNYINGELSRISYFENRFKVPGSNNSYLQAEVDVAWSITSVYGENLYSDTIKGASGAFALRFLEEGQQVTVPVADAVQASLIEFLNEIEEKGMLDRENPQTLEDEPLLTLNLPTASPGELSEAIDATVTVKVDEGHGSGFFVSPDGFALTNYHVVANSEKIELLTKDGKTVDAFMIRKDQRHDVALLKADIQPSQAFVLPTSPRYKVGESIFTIGTPRSIELGQTLSKGIISGKRIAEDVELLQTDASINFGNSGGPIVSENGELLGLVNSKLVGVGVEGIAFGIPAYLLMDYLRLRYE